MPARIEHTLLKMDATPNQITQLCDEAIQFGFRGICCLPRYIPHCRTRLKDTQPLVISVIDFPLCGSSPRDGATLAQHAVADGAHEVDMVLDVSSLKSSSRAAVFERIALVVEKCGDVPVKVILETGFLTETEIVMACAIAHTAGAAFVKTST
ncbi:MAG: deoxyribose-phosphate aldolase, partial [Deltaproteobacteria bacterium]|nr:deoxyribose-phosphate aldolase [Deltaproteobacteria bacterium]